MAPATCSRRDRADAKTPAQLAEQIKRGIKKGTGLTVNAHLFRHVCAFLYLKAHPGDYETVRLLLGHTNLATTVRAYCGLERSDAVRRYDSLIDTYRRTQGERVACPLKGAACRSPLGRGDRLAWEAGTRRADLFEERNAGADWSLALTAQDSARLWPLALLADGERSVRPDTRAGRQGDETARRRLCRNAFRELRSIHCRLPPAGALRRIARSGAGGGLAVARRTLDATWSSGRARYQQAASPAPLTRSGRSRPTHDDLSRARDGWSERRRAVHYRDGLMIALMAYRPFRRNNFASIVLGVHLVQQSGGWWLQFPTGRMKAKRPYEVAFPAALVPELEHYLAIHRKVLLASENGQLSPSTDALWVSEVGTMLEMGALANRMRQHMQRGVRRVPPAALVPRRRRHLYRGRRSPTRRRCPPRSWQHPRHDRKALQSGAQPGGITAAPRHARGSPCSLNGRRQETR